MTDAAKAFQDSKVPCKRPRKPLNCEPCRISKLKCDRNRPCSSCLLRGHVALCYPGEDGEGGGSRASIPMGRLVSPKNEFRKLRQSLALLESHVEQLHKDAERATQDSDEPKSSGSSLKRSSMSPEPGDAASSATSGGSDGRSNKRRASASLSSAPTPDVTHMQDPFETVERSSIRLQYEKDMDLTSQLPSLNIVECLVDYYFENCNWLYYGIHRQTFGDAWVRYKTGQEPSRLVLATACVIIAIAMCHLPGRHELRERLSGDWPTLTTQYYKIMLAALERYQMGCDVYTLELIELLLLRCQYLLANKAIGEEVWRVRGDLVSMATAMGLHRDPAHCDMPLLLAERRRWAWWNIVMFERWQALMLGRPLAVASHHFDTRFPSYCDPLVDKTGLLHASNIASFRLVHIMGDVVDGIVSITPLPYVTVLSRDRLLLAWLDSVHPELDFNTFSLASGLSSPITPSYRMAIQCTFLKTVFLHLRLALHQPYIHAPHDTRDRTFSLGVATECAEQLISLSTHVCPETYGSSLPSTFTHLHLIPYHVLAAALLFIFLVSEHPEQPAAHAYRTNIYKTVATLHQLHRTPLAEAALAILRILEPLYGESFMRQDEASRVQTKADVLSKLKLLLTAIAARSTVACPSSEDESPHARAQAESSLPQYAAITSSVWERMVSQAMPQSLCAFFAAAAANNTSASTSPSSLPSNSTVPSTPGSGGVLSPGNTSPHDAPMEGSVGAGEFIDFSAISSFSGFSLVDPDLFPPTGHVSGPASPTAPHLDLAYFMRNVDGGNWEAPAGFKDELAQFFDGLQNITGSTSSGGGAQ